MNIPSPSPTSRVPSAACKIGMVLLLGIYAVIRVCYLPSDAGVAGGFSHDSAYISVVAGQLKSGNGYVNPASWLLFLNPASLPMPYHNANPLYPTVIAGVSMLTGMDTNRSGFAVSAFAHVWIMGAVFLALLRFRQPCEWAAFCAILVGLFPGTWAESLSVLPDALFMALLWSMIAILAKAANGRDWLLAGAVFGFAWLTRSTATLVLPGIFWWMYRTMPVKKAVSNASVFLLSAGLVMSPWLIHTANVWGSPFRSDAYFYWIQDYRAWRLGIDVDQYWRSLTPPPSLQQILSSEAFVLARHLLTGIPKLVYNVVAHWSSWSKPEAIVLGAAVAAGYVRFRDWRTPEFQAAAITSCFSVAALLMRASSIEIRYLNLVTSLLLIGSLLSAGKQGAFLRRFAAATWIVYALMVIPRDGTIWRQFNQPQQERIAFREAARKVNQIASGDRVLSHKPYFYTLDTGASAISPPAVSKDSLVAFLNSYQTRYLLLPAATLDYYYPGGEATLAPEIRKRDDIGGFVLLEKVDNP